MISPGQFYHAFRAAGVDFFAGVPDSLLKDFCAYVADHAVEKMHIIAANEGSAVALATGYHLATGGVPLVYLQNSGLGNLTNPLLSLVDSDVYGIPMVLLVGWRGEPGVADEPQHLKQGQVTLGLLECMGISYSVIDAAETAPESLVVHAVDQARESGRAYALVARKGSFAPYKAVNQQKTAFGWTREAAISRIASAVAPNDILVVTTGMASREMFEYRRDSGSGHEQDFLVVGGMGHASQIALGIALQKPDRRVICIDGDGAALMHMGCMATNGQSAPANFRHIIINNGAHDSVGGQPTAGLDISLVGVAQACGYKYSACCAAPGEVEGCLHKLLQSEGPSLLEVQVDRGHRADLGRPTTTPAENKRLFMDFVQS